MGRAMAVVLFTDLVGSTELRGRLGEGAAEELRRKHDGLLAEAVEAHSGQVVKGLGDGIMATFAGALDAVAAAVAIQQAVDRLNRSGKAPVPLEVRVGLSAGDVTFEDDDVHGTPVIEASRLCAVAGGGEVLVSEVVRLLAGCDDFDFAERGLLELKGLRHRVLSWQVGWEPAAASAIPMPALLTDVGRIFVGRDAELERLMQLWKEAAAGEPRLAFVAGEPGVGKTRLAAELAAVLHYAGATVLAGRCDEDLGVPYQPFVESLRHYVDGIPEARLGRYGGELVRLVPELAERVPDLSPSLQSDPETERYRLFDAVATWLSAASVDEPCLLILDDLQWAAKPTLLLLRHVMRSSEPKRLLILGTYRDTELTHDHPLVELVADLRRDGAVERLSLSGVDDRAVATIVEQAAGHALDDEGLALARTIYQETEGNPFFVREVLRHLAETSAVERAGGRWTTRVPVEQLGIPEGVRDVVGRRLARLSSAANQALRVAAVVGGEFEVPVVQTAGALREPELLRALEEASRGRLVSEVSPTRFRFSHALVRATLYDALTGPGKVVLHRQVAEAIESLHARNLDDYLPALAHHWSKASAPAAESAKAVEYARRAGDRALAQLAHDEAAAYYRQALELRAVTAAPETQQCELMILLGEAQRRAGDATHRTTLLEAGRLAQQLNAGDLLARAALANRRGLFSRMGAVDEDRVAALQASLDATGSSDSPRRARLLAALASELHFAGHHRRVDDLSREALVCARRTGDPTALAEALLAAWLAATPDPTAAEDRARFAAELADVAGQIADPVVEFHAGLVTFLTGTEQGPVAAADAALATCIRIAEEVGQPVLRWRAAYLRGHRAYLDGRIAEVDRWAEEARRLGEAAGQPDTGALSDLFIVRILQGRPGEAVELTRPLAEAFGGSPAYPAVLAWACAEAGLPDEAHARLAAVRGATFADLRRDYLWLVTVVALGRAAARLGDRGAAEELYDLLRPHHAAMARGQSTWLGPVAYDLGLLATTLGRHEDADMHFAEAVDKHLDMGVSGILPQTYLEWGRMLLARDSPGDRERAGELLHHALETARRLGVGAVEREAIALLEERG